MLEKIKFRNFTAFDKLEVNLCPGINVFIGENGTGKTHLLKAVYAACKSTKDQDDIGFKILADFLPAGGFERILKRFPVKKSSGSMEIARKVAGSKTAASLKLQLDGQKGSWTAPSWAQHSMQAVYIPIKDMLANAPGFLSLYAEREVKFEGLNADVLHKAYLPALRKLDERCKSLMVRLEKIIGGKVVIKGEWFFLRRKEGDLEFSLLAEGHRKLGLLWLLIQNGTLGKDSVLFWDEPETNLNPMLMQTVVEALVELQSMGMQVLLATHDSLILKEFDLQTSEEDKVMYHSLFRGKESGEIECASTGSFYEIEPNAINDAFGNAIGREIDKAMGDLGKCK